MYQNLILISENIPKKKNLKKKELCSLMHNQRLKRNV